jgi:hypothetical protein
VHEYVFGSSGMASSRFGVRVRPSVMYRARWQESCREQGGRDVAVGGPQIMVEDRFSRLSRRLGAHDRECPGLRERSCAGRSTWWESCGRCVSEIGLQKGVMYILCNPSRVHLIEKIANIQAVRRPRRSSSISCVRALFFFNLRSCVREESSGLDSNIGQCNLAGNEDIPVVGERLFGVE